MTDDDYPSPEQWAEMRRNGHVCAACKTRVWPAPAAVRDETALSEEECRTVARIGLQLDADADRFSTGDVLGLLAIIDRLSSAPSRGSANPEQAACGRCGLPLVKDQNGRRFCPACEIGGAE